MQAYGVNQLRKMFLEFFESKEHLAMYQRGEISEDKFRFDKQYVGKFYFSFEREAADKLADFQISVHSYNVFGTEEIVEYTDQNPNLIHTSTINLHK